MSHAHTGRRGNISILALILLVVVFACLAFAIDVGYLNLLRTRLQVAADAGAMAGTDAMGDGPSAGIRAAERFAELNFDRYEQLDVDPNRDIELGTWDEESRVFTPLSGAELNDANAVRVTCRRTLSRGTGAKLFFAKLIGRPTADVSAVAIARAKALTCGRIIGLRRVAMSGSTYTDSYNSALGSYASQSPRQRGHVCSNGPILTSGNTRINGNGHPGVGQSVQGSATVTGVKSPLSTPLDFPPVDIGNADTSNDNFRIPLTSSGRPALNSGRLVVSNGDTLDLPPGVYYFTQVTISGGGMLRTTGRTTLFVDGDCYFSGGGVVNTATRPSHLQLYCTGNTFSISGSTDFHGVIYAPDARIVRTGSSEIFGMLLGRELILSGSGAIHADESLGSLRGIPNRYTALVD